MSSASTRGARVRGALMRAAVELVGELGWSGVSTRALAERADVTPGLVHYHFESVQALLREAVLGVMRESLTTTAALLAEARTPAEGVRDLLASLDAYTGHDRTSVAVVECYLAAARDEELHRQLVMLVDQFRQDVTAWLDGHGHARPADTASVLAALIDGVLVHRPLNPALTTGAVLSVVGPLLEPGHRDEEGNRP